MNYSAKLYAKAFTETLLEKDKILVDQKIKNFLELIKKNRDQRKLKEIIRLADKFINQRTGRRKLLIESARPLSPENEKIVNTIAKPSDSLEKKVNPDIIAGLKITINDELLLDGSFSKKLTKILNAPR